MAVDDTEVSESSTTNDIHEHMMFPESEHFLEICNSHANA